MRIKISDKMKFKLWYFIVPTHLFVLTISLVAEARNAVYSR